MKGDGVALNSMTGFARTEGANDFCTWVWEAKSVNAKGLDARLRLPGGFEGLEPEIRQRTKSRFHRGNISLSLNVNWQRPNATYHINMETLDGFLSALPDILARAPDLAPATTDGLLALKGVIEGIEEPLAEAQQATLHADVMDGLDQVLDQLAEGRAKEGAQLANVLDAQISSIDELCDEAESLAALQPEAIKARLAEQVTDLLDAVPALPADRLAQEAAVLMLKADVREELDRLKAHRDAARDLMVQKGAIGRQFDFLCQEFNREANTLCSKSADVALTQVGLTLKTVIDQMREQIQNVE